MSEKINLTSEQLADRADPANEASRNEAWGVDPKTFNNGNDYLSGRPDVTPSESVDDLIFNAHPDDGDLYHEFSLRELAAKIKEADANNDKSTSLEIQNAIWNRLEKFVEEGQLTEDGAMNRLEQLMGVMGWNNEVKPAAHLVVSDDEKNERATQVLNDEKRVKELRDMSLDDLKKLYVEANGQEALDQLENVEGLKELSDEELLALSDKAEFNKTQKPAKDAEQAQAQARAQSQAQATEYEKLQNYYDRIENIALEAFRNASKDELETILKAAYGEDQFKRGSNPGSNWVSKTKYWSMHKLGSIDVKAMRKVNDIDAIAIVFDAIENGYGVNGITIDDVARLRANGDVPENAPVTTESSTTAEINSDTSQDPAEYLHLDAEGRQTERNKDMVALYKQLDPTEQEKILEIVFDNDEKESFTFFQSKNIHSDQDLLKEENEGILADLVDKAVKKGYNFPDLRKRSGTSNAKAANAQPLEGSFGEKQTQAIDINSDDDAPTTELPRDMGNRAGLTGPINYSNETSSDSFENQNGNRRRSILDRVRGVGRNKVGIAAGALALVGAGILTWKFYGDHTIAGNAVAAKDVKDILKQSVGPLGAASRHTKETILDNLSHIPVPDGSGGEQLVQTINNQLHLNLDAQFWYQHEQEFMNAFPDYTYVMSDGHVGLLDLDKNTDFSQYDLTRMQQWFASRPR